MAQRIADWTHTFNAKGKVATAVALILANALSDPLAQDLRDTFGSVLWRHPATVWVAVTAIVAINTGSIVAGVCVSVAYEAIKVAWKAMRIDPPFVVRLRRILTHARRGRALDDEDVKFIDQVTPPDVTFVRRVRDDR